MEEKEIIKIINAYRDFMGVTEVNSIDEFQKQIKNADYLIGIDIADKNSQDFSSLSMRCLNCNTLIHNEIFKGEKPQNKCPIICPNCQYELKNGFIFK